MTAVTTRNKRPPFPSRFPTTREELDSWPADEQQAWWYWMTQPPPTDEALQTWVHKFLGLHIPDTTCENPAHTSPLQAFADAYYARYPRCVWHGSRGLSGKTVLLAALSVTEMITYGASVTLLGGSGEQSQRVHKYMGGSEIPDAFWGAEFAPTHLLENDPTKRETVLTNRGSMLALMASQRSVRGPHPHRLRGDEIDEMKQDIWNAAAGQPMTKGGIPGQIVGCSTHQHAEGTMTEEFRLAAEKGWPIYTWCFECVRHDSDDPDRQNNWCTDVMIEEKRAQVTSEMWRVEYELGEPSIEGRAVMSENVDRMFDPDIGKYPGKLGTKLIFEKPKENGTYAVGADWGKTRDKTVIVVLRADVSPARIVAFYHLGRQPYPQMVDLYNKVVKAYVGEASERGAAAHNATGLGGVIDDYLEVMADAFRMQGLPRKNLLNNYIIGIEDGEIVGPRIAYMYQEHKFVTNADLYEKTGHPPDSFVAGAMAYRAAQSGELFY